MIGTPKTHWTLQQIKLRNYAKRQHRKISPKQAKVKHVQPQQSRWSIPISKTWNTPQTAAVAGTVAIIIHATHTRDNIITTFKTKQKQIQCLSVSHSLQFPICPILSRSATMSGQSVRVASKSRDTSFVDNQQKLKRQWNREREYSTFRLFDDKNGEIIHDFFVLTIGVHLLWVQPDYYLWPRCRRILCNPPWQQYHAFICFSIEIMNQIKCCRVFLQMQSIVSLVLAFRSLFIFFLFFPFSVFVVSIFKTQATRNSFTVSVSISFLFSCRQFPKRGKMIG